MDELPAPPVRQEDPELSILHEKKGEKKKSMRGKRCLLSPIHLPTSVKPSDEVFTKIWTRFPVGRLT